MRAAGGLHSCTGAAAGGITSLAVGDDSLCELLLSGTDQCESAHQLLHALRLHGSRASNRGIGCHGTNCGTGLGAERGRPSWELT